MTQRRPSTSSDLARLPRQLRLTRLGLLAERAARAFWPVVTLLLLTAALIMLGATTPLPRLWFNALGLAVGLAVLALLYHGLRRFRWPTEAEARARLDATMPGRPLAALADSQAIGTADPASQAVWQAHVARMRARAAQARAPRPDLNLRHRDPFALRHLALTLGGMALIFGSGARLSELGQVAPQGAQALVAGPVWEGWIRPPAYTGKPAIYLNDVTDDALELPQGSRVLLRFYGPPGALGLNETVSNAPLPVQVAEGEANVLSGAEFTAEQHGQIDITGPNGRSWQIAVLRDLPPLIATSAAPERQADGRMKLPFTAEDDYGVVKGRAVIALDLGRVDRRYGLTAAPEPRPELALDLPMPYTRKRNEIAATLIEDLSKHPFANLPVRISLSAEDAAGQTGTSAPLDTVLPGKRFFDPLAASISELRRDLLWSLENRARSAQVLRAVLHRPEGLMRNEGLYLRLISAIGQIEATDLTPERRDALADELWDIALALETGDLASALERLKRAQDRLDEAMKNGASESEIAELMQELREALDAYMRQLAQESERDPAQQPQNMDGMQMTGDQLQEMLDKLQELMEQGKMAEAMELMEMLRQLMENMQVVPGEGQGQGEGQGRMRDLAETLRQQQGLSDEAFRQLQEGFERELGRQPGQGQEGQSGQQPGQQGQGQQGQGQGRGQDQPGQGQSGQQGRGQQGQGQSGNGQLGENQPGQGQEGDLAQRQRELRNQLGALGRTELPGDGSETAEAGRRALERSGEAMEGAEEALRQGDLPRALDRQSEAMEALREGMRAFNEAMAEERRPGGQPGESDRAEGADRGDPRGRRDPLGRRPGQSGRMDQGEEMLPGEDPYRRAEDLLNELRRRSGEQERPEAERDYFGRLLDQF